LKRVFLSTSLEKNVDDLCKLERKCAPRDLGIETQVGFLDPRLAVCLIHSGTGAEPFNLSVSKDSSINTA
jgi:hypothetical protein